MANQQRGGDGPIQNIVMVERSRESIVNGDLTLRTEEVETLKACINVGHIWENVGDRLWWTQTGTLFAKQIQKEIEGSEWEGLYLLL